MQFRRFSSEPHFEGKPLFVALVTIGNVGQLAADLLLSSLQLVSVGVLEDELLLPFIGVDSFTPQGSTTVSAIEVYSNSLEDDKQQFFVIQQRSVACKGAHEQLARRLVEWVQQAQFSKVTLLGSLSAAARGDRLLNAPNVSLVSHVSLTEDSGVEQLSSLSVLDQVTAEPGSQLRAVVQVTRELSLPARLAFCFASEGDNRADAVQLASALLAELRGVVPEQISAGNWTVPQSWKLLYGYARETEVSVR